MLSHPLVLLLGVDLGFSLDIGELTQNAFYYGPSTQIRAESLTELPTLIVAALEFCPFIVDLQSNF